jgi:hypothetical protein
MRVRVVTALAFAALTLGACSHDATPRELALVYNHHGFVMEPPPPDSAPAKWSHKEALKQITKGNPDGDKTHAWFGYYQGHPAWLAITNNAQLAIPGGGASVPTRGHRIEVFADGETPLHEITGVYGAGTAPLANVAPPRPKQYTGRLHTTFITAGAAEVASIPTKWMIEPAPKKVQPRMSVEEATRRSRATGVNQVDARSTRVYFGYFTGQEIGGAVRAHAPGWLVVGTFPEDRYAVTVFSDDLTQPWVSGRLLLQDRPLAY